VTVKELLATQAVQEQLSDSLETGYATDELIAHLNDALDFVWHVLIKNKYYEVINDLVLTAEETDVPDDWYKATNQAPIQVKGGKLVCYGKLPYTVRYYKKYKFLTSETDTLPLKNDGLNDLATQIMVVLAMSNHGFDMQMESDFAQAIANLL
jgi:hypothetical protein